MTRFVPAWAITIGLLLGSPLSAAELNTNDWSQWRGPQRDGISPDKGLLKSWDEAGPPLLYQTKGLGKGFSSVAVSNGKIYTMGQRDKAEKLMCLDAETGKELWAVEIGSGDHSNCTPTVDGDLVYGVGLKGDLVCVNAADGKIVWRKNYGNDFGGKMMSGWGFSESPLIDGERLICTPGANDAIMASLDKKTGNVIWKAAQPSDIGDRGKDGAAYSSVVISEACGVKQYVQLVGRGLIGVDAATGKTLWTYNRIANGTANIPTPLVQGDYIFTSTGYQTGAALLKIVKTADGLKAEEQYFLKSDVMQNHHGGMIILGNYLFCGHGHNKGLPLCIEWKTGKEAWRPGRGPGGDSAAISYADGKLYFRYQDGTMALIDADPQAYHVAGTFKIPVSAGPSWPHPVISGGRLYLREQDTLLVYDIKAKGT